MMDVRSFSDDRLSAAGGPDDLPSNMARLADLRFGGTTIQPSRLRIEGARGVAKVEPRIMRVLLALLKADGAVVTREDLIELSWAGTIVGDDAIHRAISQLRRAAIFAGAGFTIETVPKAGYRLVPTAAIPGQPTPPSAVTGRIRIDRRLLLLSGFGATAVGAGYWYSVVGRPDPEVAALIERGRRALRDELPDGDAQGVAQLSRAVQIEPRNAEAWGLLALAHRNVAENADPSKTAAAVHASEVAANRALAIDRDNGDALTALATLQPYFGDWMAAEERLLRVLAVAPDSVAAISHFVTLLQSVGRTLESRQHNDRAAALDPFSPVHQYRKGLKFWILGDVASSDLTLDRALTTWPRHPGVWNARLMMFAFTDRAEAGLTMLQDVTTRPTTMPQPAIDLWQTTLRGLRSRAPNDVAAARAANVAASGLSPGYALNAIMALSAMNELDAAFAVSSGFLLRRGELIGHLWTGRGQMPVNDQRWRRTMFLYTPACAAMRADPRFAALCDGIGLTEYWQRRGIIPDHLASGGLARRPGSATPPGPGNSPPTAPS